MQAIGIRSGGPRALAGEDMICAFGKPKGVRKHRHGVANRGLTASMEGGETT